MSLTTFLSKILGNKSQRDLKEIKPTIDKINAIGPTMSCEAKSTRCAPIWPPPPRMTRKL